MYLDAMQQIYGNATKVIVDSRQGGNLLYLPLDKIMQMSSSGADTVGVGAASGASGAAPVHVLPPNSVSTDARGRESARTRDRESR
jgi:membrane protease subunit HflK